MPFFLGIDGGGSKTRCIVGDDKAMLASGNASGCNVLRVGEGCAQSALEAAIHETCVAAGISPRDIDRTCAGVAGAGRPAIAAIMRRILAGIVSGKVEITGDSEIAFESAFASGPGVIVISGTGSTLNAVAAMKSGATDFLDKPVENGGLALSRYTASLALLVFIVACLLIFPPKPAEGSH